MLVLLIVLSISACGGSADVAEETGGSPFKAADLVGKWKGTGDEISTITFGKNGSYKDDAGFAVVKPPCGAMLDFAGNIRPRKTSTV